MGPNYYVDSQPASNGPGQLFAGKAKFIIAGLILAVVIGAGLMLAGGGGSNTQGKAGLTNELTSMISMMSNENVKRNIKDADLNRIVTDYSLTLQTDLNDLSGESVTVPPLVDTSELGAKLQDAYLNSELDRVFAEELLSSTQRARISATQVLEQSENKELVQQLKTVDTHLSEIEKILKDLSL